MELRLNAFVHLNSQVRSLAIKSDEFGLTTLWYLHTKLISWKPLLLDMDLDPIEL